MMTPSNGNIFRVTGPLCGEFTGPGEFPTQRPVTRSFDVFFDLRLNKRLSKQSRGWWLETLSCSLWRQSNDERGPEGMTDRADNIIHPYPRGVKKCDVFPVKSISDVQHCDMVVVSQGCDTERVRERVPVHHSGGWTERAHKGDVIDSADAGRAIEEWDQDGQWWVGEV